MTAAYLYFVKIYGPKWMQNRPAFDLRNIMIAYNFTMVVVSGLMFIEMANLIQWGRYTFRCQKVDTSTGDVPMRMCRVGWLFLVTKYVEFIDTVFFVLRKKQSQVSTLHVVHHSVVPISVWVAVKYAPGGNNVIFPVLNSGVHTVMYLYYGLAAFGPSIQKYLWWKKYLTSLQLLQFVLVMTHGFINFMRDCEFPRSFVVLNLCHAVLFFYLFTHFYRQSYRKALKAAATGVTISHTSMPRGAATYAKIGELTITASVHYGKQNDDCHQDFKAKTTTFKAFNDEDAKKID
ncbi:elongation of very long chain fatty acids protein-like protein [Leptotrombidium deliense]|uniref:Elongation of very long chain fatty acids protein n=1 Tax=Leptotrombidium deliense TaxID=299467 RepID=A0A443SI35_9ACAR|nr:elongation of very long chain fatty acids protein-like protein [Leptotrombidium deliense]